MKDDTSTHALERSPMGLPVTAAAVMLISLLSATALLSGCGPVESTVGISDAEAALTQATTLNAEQHSPYEYTRAQHFLYKAKQEWGYSNFETARDYALEARRSADAALENTREAPWQGHPIYGFDGRSDEIDQLEDRLEDASFDEMEEVDELH